MFVEDEIHLADGCVVLLLKRRIKAKARKVQARVGTQPRVVARRIDAHELAHCIREAQAERVNCSQVGLRKVVGLTIAASHPDRAGLQVFGWYVAGNAAGAGVNPTLEVAEKEDAIFNDPTPNRAAELISDQRFAFHSRPIGEPIIRRQRGVPVEFIRRTMELIRARLRHQGYLAARRAALIGVGAANGHAKFSDRIKRYRQRGVEAGVAGRRRGTSGVRAISGSIARYTTRLVVVHVDAVQRHVVLVAASAEHFAGLRHAGLQAKQFDNVAGGQGELANLRFIKSIANGRVHRIQRRRIAGHVDRFSGLADFQPNIERGRGANHQADAAVQAHRKAGLFRFYVVKARGHLLELIVPLVVRQGFPAGTGVFRRHADGSGGDCSPLRIRDRAPERRQRLGEKVGRQQRTDR